MTAFRPVLLCLLALGCHARYRREVASIEAMRLEITTPAAVDVDLGRVYTTDPRMEPMADAYNLDLWMQETELESIIAGKVDDRALSSAFQYGIRESLGAGPPFAAVDQATHVLDIQVVDWGLRVIGFRIPAVFQYRVRVMGWRPDGSVFYRTTFRCFGDAGPVSWLPHSLSTDLQRIRSLDPDELQPALDRAANQCGVAFADRLREHAGISPDEAGR